MALQREEATDAEERRWTWGRHAWKHKSGLGPDGESNLENRI